MEKLIQQWDFANWFIKANQRLNGIVWGPFMLLLLLGLGVYLTVKTHFIPLTWSKRWISQTIGSVFHQKKRGQGISPFQATATALAGTMGTGNIVGVATALTAGGPGAIFWMWVSALFGMTTKYAEIVLAVCFREKNNRNEWVGGPMYYIEKGLHQKWLAVLFSCFCTLASFGIGNMTQVNAIAQSMKNTFQIDPLITGIICALLTGMVILGGVKRIAKLTAAIIPALSVFYLLGCMTSLILCADQIPEAFHMIVTEAFEFRAAGGGALGYACLNAVRYGFSRGVFSNEAGLGSAPIAHAASNTEQPVEQGMWGIFEVFVDTILVCTMTALVILTSGVYGQGIDGAVLTSAAFSKTLGDFAGAFLSVSIALFAFSTLTSWSYYGEQCVEYLFHSQYMGTVYRFAYVLLILAGSVMQLQLVWSISDTMNGLMAIPNLIGLVCLSKIVVKETQKYRIKHR